MRLYRKFLQGGIPEYLARYYWWAYLWEKSIWFFDHQPVINAILFGQYENLLKATLRRVDARADARLLQLTCVYGKLTPALLRHAAGDLHLCDVAGGQLDLARGKTWQAAARCHLARMNAEVLAYADDTFDQVIVFFLFHELPPAARQHVYAELARVVKRGGSVLITEYGGTPRKHMFYRFWPFRWLLGSLEPFLPGFWQEDVESELQEALRGQGKSLACQPAVEPYFWGFYRVIRFDIHS